MSIRYRSWSQLNQFEQCPLQYRLKRRDKVPVTQSVWLPGGTAYHAACEQFDLYACEHGLDAAVKEGGWDVTFQGEFASELDKLRELEVDDTKWRKAKSTLKDFKAEGESVVFWQLYGPSWVNKYVKWRQDNRHLDILRLPNGVPLLELEVRVLVGGVPTIAKADLALQDQVTGATIAVDRKSGKSTPDSMDQILLYAQTLRQAGVKQLWYGAYFMARPGKLTEPRPLDLMDPDDLGRRMAAMDRDERAGLYPAKLNRLCNWCEVNQHCDAFKKESQ